MHAPDTTRPCRWPLMAALLGAASALGATWWAHAAMPAFDARSMPLAMAGTPGVPGAEVFNLLAFIVPGACAAACAIQWWRAVALRAFAARIGAGLAVLAALAFIAQGAWPLQGDLVAGSGARIHAAAWMAWWLGAASAGVATALGLVRRQPAMAVGSAVAAIAIVLCALNLVGLPPGWAHRASVLAWGAWTWLLALRLAAPARPAPRAQP